MGSQQHQKDRFEFLMKNFLSYLSNMTLAYLVILPVTVQVYDLYSSPNFNILIITIFVNFQQLGIWKVDENILQNSNALSS